MSGDADGGAAACPSVEVFVHPEHSLPDGFEFGEVVQIADAGPALVAAVARGGSPFLDLAEIEVTLVSDPIIAQVHVDFMDIPGATDVITFDHGEIVISTDTARRQATEHGNSPERETSLYLVHGLLHLAGYADKDEADFAEMSQLQERLLGEVWGGV